MEDEYESYAMGAFDIVLKGGHAEQVIEYLRRAETVTMALHGHGPRAEAVGRKLDAGVRRILGIWRAFQPWRGCFGAFRCF